MLVKEVQIIDLENAVHLPKRTRMKRTEVGNAYWRGPEANFRGRLHWPSDIFSFGIVMSISAPIMAHSDNLSASSLCSDALSLGLMMISKNT